MAEGSLEELYSSLMKWLENCLALGGTLNFEPTEVNDGSAMADCLVQLAPDFFTVTWRARIINETGGNWKLKLSNLKKIYNSIQEFYSNVLHLSLSSSYQPNLTSIAESGSESDLAILIQLVLGIAINCEHKDTYIQAIMGLQKDVQHVVMGAIQSLMNQQSPSMVSSEDYKALEEESKQALEELRRVKEQEESLLQERHDMVRQLTESQEVFSSLRSEADGLRAQLAEAQTSSGITGEVKVQQIQRQLENSKVEKLQLETERDDYKLKIKELSGQVQSLMEHNRSLQQENEELPQLRDTVEEMKYLESKVKNYESVISQYKKKLEDSVELRKQLKATEDRNIMYMQNNMDLEEELRRQGMYKKQLETQRQRVQELESELAQEKLRSLEASQEAEEKVQQLDTLKTELAQVKQERDSYSVQSPGTPLAEFSMFSAPSKSKHGIEPMGSFSEPDLGGVAGGVGLVEAYTPELREKMVKLEKENQILRRRLDSSDTSYPSEVGSGEEVSRQQLEEVRRRLSLSEKEVKKQGAGMKMLQQEKNSKDKEIEKYKKYLNKAKKIIENIGENKTQKDDSLEVQSLRSRVKEKEKELEQLEKEYQLSQQSWQREEKLVVSAWHEMGLMMHQKYSHERVLAKQGASFLARQRQALYKNPVPLNTAIANTLASSSSPSDGHS